MMREWEPINWAAKPPRKPDWDGNTRLRGLTVLLRGMQLFAVWAGVNLLVWGIGTALFGPEKSSHVFRSEGFYGVVLVVSGVVLMLAGASMGITGVAIDKITVPSWLDPGKWNRLLFGICYLVILLLVIWVYLRFF